MEDACRIISTLPIELRRLIFYFLPANIIRSREAKIIGNVIEVYKVDHHYEWTRWSHIYFLKDIVSFCTYVFISYDNENENGMDFGRTEFERHELSDSVKQTIMELKPIKF
jgi:hypothetical protein